jgi:hypothetical protein
MRDRGQDGFAVTGLLRHRLAAAALYRLMDTAFARLPKVTDLPPLIYSMKQGRGRQQEPEDDGCAQAPA